MDKLFISLFMKEYSYKNRRTIDFLDILNSLKLMKLLRNNQTIPQTEFIGRVLSHSSFLLIACVAMETLHHPHPEWRHSFPDSYSSSAVLSATVFMMCC